MHLVSAVDHAEVALRWTLRLWIKDALERVFEVRSRHLAAILKLDASPQLKRIGLAVAGYGVGFGNVRDEFEGAGLVVHQAIEERLHH